MPRAGRWSWIVLLAACLLARPADAQETASASAISPELFRTLARQQNPAVVSIATRERAEALPPDMQELLSRIVGRPPAARIQRNAGSGFLISATGEILTNDHLVADAFTIDVTLHDDPSRSYRATLVARDPVSDVALIRLARPPADLPFVRLGDSDSLEPGDWVMAIGNPFQLGHTVSVGVVSHVGRMFQFERGISQRMIQTDAITNVGSSGGPLFNVRGEVVGMTSAMVIGDAADSAGISFAIPINDITPLLPQLRAGSVVRGRIGVRVHDQPLALDEAAALGLTRVDGALITFVEHDSPAARAGLQAGDVVRMFDGATIRTAGDLLPRLATARPGCEVPIDVVRGGTPRRVTVGVEALAVAAPAGPPPAMDDLFGLTIGDEDGVPSLDQGLASRAVVDAIDEESAAWVAGVVEGDIVLQVNGTIVDNAAAVTAALRRVSGTAPAFLLLSRDGDQVLVRMRRDLP